MGNKVKTVVTTKPNKTPSRIDLVDRINSTCGGKKGPKMYGKTLCNTNPRTNPSAVPATPSTAVTPKNWRMIKLPVAPKVRKTAMVPSRSRMKGRIVNPQGSRGRGGGSSNSANIRKLWRTTW